MSNRWRRDPQGVRQRILSAATEEFSRRGFAGARVDRIAARARVNKRMLYHYYGDKIGLQRAVLDSCLGNGTSPDALDTLPNPEAARLILWALLEEEASADAQPAGLSMLEGRIIQAQRQGRLAPHLDHRRLALLLLWGGAALAIAAQRAPADGAGEFLASLLQSLAPAAGPAMGIRKPRVRLKPRRS
jgi:AcrR family transcriptional regulator